MNLKCRIRHWLVAKRQPDNRSGCEQAATSEAGQNPARAESLPSHDFGIASIRPRFADRNCRCRSKLPSSADARYSGIEPWIGGLAGARRKAAGRSTTLRSSFAIGGCLFPVRLPFFLGSSSGLHFQRAEGLEQAKREMDLAGGSVPRGLPAHRPARGCDGDRISLSAAAEQLSGSLLPDLGVSMGIVPHLELWGFSKIFSRLGEALQIAMESGPSAGVPFFVGHVFHIYKGELPTFTQLAGFMKWTRRARAAHERLPVSASARRNQRRRARLSRRRCGTALARAPHTARGAGSTAFCRQCFPTATIRWRMPIC